MLPRSLSLAVSIKRLDRLKGRPAATSCWQLFLGETLHFLPRYTTLSRKKEEML